MLFRSKQFKRLGVVGDWENYYSTMSFDAEAQIVRELGKFLKEGSLYRGYKPVLWSTVEKMSAYGMSDEEVVNLIARQLPLPIEFPLWKMAFTSRSSKVKNELK